MLSSAAVYRFTKKNIFIPIPGMHTVEKYLNREMHARDSALLLTAVSHFCLGRPQGKPFFLVVARYCLRAAFCFHDGRLNGALYRSSLFLFRQPAPLPAIIKLYLPNIPDAHSLLT